jgi:hypothetical protein
MDYYSFLVRHLQQGTLLLSIFESEPFLILVTPHYLSTPYAQFSFRGFSNVKTCPDVLVGIWPTWPSTPIRHHPRYRTLLQPAGCRMEVPLFRSSSIQTLFPKSHIKPIKDERSSLLPQGSPNHSKSPYTIFECFSLQISAESWVFKSGLRT